LEYRLFSKDTTRMLLLDIRLFLLLTLFYGSQAQRAENSKVLPYQVRVRQCVGSLIKLDWILTAKHCVSDVKWNRQGTKEFGKPSPQTVWAGQEMRKIPTTDIFSHSDADLVLLRVDPPFEESEFIKPIRYNNVISNLEWKDVSMFKWKGTMEKTDGIRTWKVNEADGLPKELIKTPIKIWKYDPQGTNKAKSPKMVMYKNHRDANACWGDNEGPAVFKNNNHDLLVGVGESVRGSCDPDDPSQDRTWSSDFVNVFHYKEWIEQTMNTGTCTDNDRDCSSWRDINLCFWNDYVRANCKNTCNLCDGNRGPSKSGQNGNWKNGNGRQWNRWQRGARD